MLADPAAIAAAQDTVNVHLDTWLGEREIGFAEANTPPFTIHLVGKVEQHAFEIAKGDIPPHNACEFAVPLPLPFSNELIIDVSFAASAPTGLYDVVALEIRKSERQ